MPSNVGRLKLYQDHTPLFPVSKSNTKSKARSHASVSLPSGGAIVIDHTEALVSIDVNSARATRGSDIEDTAFKPIWKPPKRLPAKCVCADLGGLVVIDFIDMENPAPTRC